MFKKVAFTIASQGCFFARNAGHVQGGKEKKPFILPILYRYRLVCAARLVIKLKS